MQARSPTDRFVTIMQPSMQNLPNTGRKLDNFTRSYTAAELGKKRMLMQSEVACLVEQARRKTQIDCLCFWRFAKYRMVYAS